MNLFSQQAAGLGQSGYSHFTYGEPRHWEHFYTCLRGGASSVFMRVAPNSANIAWYPMILFKGSQGILVENHALETNLFREA